MDYHAYYRKAEAGGYQEYYDAIAKAQGIDPQATARTRNAEDAVPGEAKDKLFNVAAEIKNTFHEFGAPLPPLLEGCTVVDLCCGSGRDTYLAAQLVGPAGKVVGVEPNAERLAIAQKYLDKEMKQFGYGQPNVELVRGVPEDLSFLADGTADVVISNCTFNLSPDKAAYVAEVKRVLKPQGEWYFTDVFTDRRIPQETSDKIENVALRLGGALFVEDFRRIAQGLGFHDPRYVVTRKTPLTDAEASLFPGIAFATVTCRLLNSELTSDHCEDYGEEVVYVRDASRLPRLLPVRQGHQVPGRQAVPRVRQRVGAGPWGLPLREGHHREGRPLGALRRYPRRPYHQDGRRLGGHRGRGRPARHGELLLGKARKWTRSDSWW